MYSDFFCLFDSNKHFSYNFLKECYDIKFIYSLQNAFFRNIDGKGQIANNKKYRIRLSGRGFLSDFEGSNFLSFFSSVFFESINNDRSYFAIFKDIVDKNKVFEVRWFEFLVSSSVMCASEKRDFSFGFPILNLCLISKSFRNGFWILEMEEQ